MNSLTQNLINISIAAAQKRIFFLSEQKLFFYIEQKFFSFIIDKFFENKELSLRTKKENCHSLDILSILFGALLGESYAEKRGPRVRFFFTQSRIHVEYLMKLHNVLANAGYCSRTKPKLKKSIKKKGLVYFSYGFNTWSFRSLVFLYELFYKEGKKKVPCNKALDLYLTPYALAVWRMHDGRAHQKGFHWYTNCFTKDDLERLTFFLFQKYSLKVSVQKSRQENRYVIYLSVNSMSRFVELISPYIVPRMQYKFLKLIKRPQNGK